MYLKEIKTKGFKSFADNITIELHKGITGVVGPNGSGKSNVVDAVRWVLGEQSVKSLRGDMAMTDVIFSGSKSRNPMNTASVTLIFDNSDKYLPLEYDEVAIKRRVYKDGTSEYYINEEKVRLKDVTNILLDSGISKESFNIISQGQIEEIISSKPTDRRTMFEEASGVLKYKKRKEEALRKLDKTKSNIDRINDIIKELEERVNPLKKQKEDALLYLELNEDLEDVEIALVTEDITHINYDYQANKQKIDILNSEIMSLSTSNNVNETKIEKYKKDILDIENQIKTYQNKLLEMTTLVEQLNSRKLIITERKNYEATNVKLHETIINLKEKELTLKNEINKIETDSINLNNEINKIKEDEDKENLKLENIKNNKKKLEINLTNNVREENKIKIKIETLKNIIDNNDSLPYAVKSVLNNPKLRGIHNVIGNLLETEEKYSSAISTALGYSSNNIVVDNEICAKEAINYLKNVGRATFFPINIIKPKYIDADTINQVKNIEGFINVASNLVKTEAKYENIIKNQLGNIIIVNNIDNANKISKNINYKYRIITLDGEVIHVGGSITGGRNIKTRNIINDKYELENNIKLLEKQENIIKSLEIEINDIDQMLKNTENKIYLINKEKQLKEDSYLNKQNQKQILKSDLEKVNIDIRGTNNIIDGKLSNEEEEVLEKYYAAIKTKEEINSNLEVLAKEKTNLNIELNDYEFNLKKENSEFNIKNNELKNLEIEINRMDVKLDNLLNILSETYSMSYEKAKENYKLDMNYNDAKTKVNSLKRKLKEIGPVNVNAIEEYDNVSERYDFLIKQVEDLTNAENTLLEIIEEMDNVMIKSFKESFDIINKHFEVTFKELFGGGKASLKLTEPNNLLETGVEIEAEPPGKKLKNISLLSGGEKTLTSISLLFAILKTRPAPFCILDEVEAALDEANVDTFGKYVSKLKDKSQFILITHKKVTMEYADVLYGITMQESGVSKLVSVRLEDIKE